MELYDTYASLYISVIVRMMTVFEINPSVLQFVMSNASSVKLGVTSILTKVGNLKMYGKGIISYIVIVT